MNVAHGRELPVVHGSQVPMGTANAASFARCQKTISYWKLKYIYGSSWPPIE